MNLRQQIQKILSQEDLNFLLTNRLPRRWLTQFMGRFSKIENPLVARGSIAARARSCCGRRCTLCGGAVR